MGLKGTGMGIHWDGGTIGWGYNRTGAQWDGDIVGLGHNGMGIQ